jgi:hypothetical protein
MPVEDPIVVNTEIGELHISDPVVVMEPSTKQHKHKNKKRHKRKKKMASVETPTFLATGGNEGAGIGGIGGVLVGALLARGGLLGNDRGVVGEGCVTPATFTAGITGVTDAIQNTEVMSSLGDIKAAIPLAEAQVQLALAVTQSELAGQINTANIANLVGQAAINKNISEAIAASLASQNNINVNVLQTGTANLMATKDAQFALSNIVKEDGEKTRALITSNQISELQRLAAERQDEIIELRNGSARDRDRHGIEINMINNQNQNQMQFQQQAQALVSLGHCLADVSQLARATNTNLIVGNTGAVATGPQTANPVNVKA